MAENTKEVRVRMRGAGVLALFSIPFSSYLLVGSSYKCVQTLIDLP